MYSFDICTLDKSRPRPTRVPTLGKTKTQAFHRLLHRLILFHLAQVGFFTGLALGTAMGMNKGMRTLRNSLPQDSELRRLIHANDQLRKEAILLSQQQQEDDNKPVSKD